MVVPKLPAWIMVWSIYVTFSVLSVSFYFVLCLRCGRKQKKCQNETVFREWEKGDRFSKHTQMQKSKTCCNIQFSFQGLIKIHSSTTLKAHATHEKPHCYGRRRNLFLNNCNIITIIRGKKITVILIIEVHIVYEWHVKGQEILVCCQ